MIHNGILEEYNVQAHMLVTRNVRENETVPGEFGIMESDGDNIALELLKLANKAKKECSNRGVGKKKRIIPILASRLTQLGIELPVSRIQASLQKWLQFLVMRLYAFPL